LDYSPCILEPLINHKLWSFFNCRGFWRFGGNIWGD